MNNTNLDVNPHMISGSDRSSDLPLITIPARSGSKRLPHKNTLSLHGKPLFYYSVKAALEAAITPEIYVLSDSSKTLALAQHYGAKPFLLPSALADDTSGVVKASLYLVEELGKKGHYFKDLICLQPTSPLRTAEDLKQSYSQFKEKEVDTLVSVSEVDPHYFHWAVESSSDQKFAKLYFGEKFLKPRQELPPMYFPNGAVKIAKINVLQNQQHFFGKKMAAYIMPQEQSIHISTRVDFDLCSLLMKRKKREESKDRNGEIKDEP